ncbi:MAG: hypothetical protein CM15mV142_400 [Caudoviricetes sp.]|nr:MAG: hypothetical protein CM15mV142_400 [Caudoviricetes sp.]
MILEDLFSIQKNGDSSPSKRLSINSTGGLQIFTNTSTHPNVSAFESNHTGSFTSDGMVLNTLHIVSIIILGLEQEITQLT